MDIWDKLTVWRGMQSLQKSLHHRVLESGLTQEIYELLNQATGELDDRLTGGSDDGLCDDRRFGVLDFLYTMRVRTVRWPSGISYVYADLLIVFEYHALLNAVYDLFISSCDPRVKLDMRHLRWPGHRFCYDGDKQCLLSLTTQHLFSFVYQRWFCLYVYSGGVLPYDVLHDILMKILPPVVVDQLVLDQDFFSGIESQFMRMLDDKACLRRYTNTMSVDVLSL